MSKSQEIEQRLSEIDGALFQNVCDAVLYYTEHDYPNIFRSGSQTGKTKTVKGSPDSFFILSNGRYVLVEYTTLSYSNKKKFIKKVKADIDKCLDEAKTGITIGDIAKIIYCCNSAITLKDSKELVDYCREKGVKIEFKGIHTIARMLAGRCAQVAREFLQVSIDTGQVLTPEVFASEYASSGLATTLTNEFKHREKEIDELIASIRSTSKVTIITGPPGVGKSKLAMEAFNRINHQGRAYEVFCITNKNANIHEDLRVYLSEDKNYLILVDDANRQSDHFQSVLYLLNERRNFKIHVLVTVRDYALQEISLRCKDFETNIISVGSLTDQDLTDILKGADFNINNLAVKRVLEIANGNPRLAIMATRVALEANDVNALSDVSNIYDKYFQGAIGDNRVFSDLDLLKTLGLLSFFFSFDLDDTEFIEDLTKRFEIDLYKFKDSLIALEKLELAETTPDFSMIKIGDQVVATYFFYKTFIKEDILDLRVILRHYFNSHLRRIKDAVIPANNTFTYENVYPKIDPILTEFWKEIAHDSSKAFEFLKMFWFYRPDDTFAFIAGKLSQSIPPPTLLYRFDKQPGHPFGKEDEHLELLANFFTQPVNEIKTAIELSFDYAVHFPENYTQLLNSIKSRFIFRYEDEHQSHFRQLALWDVIIENARKGNLIYIQAFFDIGPDLMKPSFHVSSAGRKANTISMYNFNVRLMEGVVTFRRSTWEFLNEKFKEYEELSIQFLLRYLERSPDRVKDVYRFDLDFLLNLFDTNFTNSSFPHCYIVSDLIYWFKRVEITHPRFEGLKAFFTNEVYQHYVLLSWDRLRDKFDYNYDYDDYEKYDRIKETEIRRTMDLKTITEFEDFYLIFLQIYNWKENEVFQVNKSLNIVLNQAFLNDSQLGFVILQRLIESGNPSAVVPYNVYRVMWVYSEQSLNHFNSILTNTFKNRTGWIFAYLNFAPIQYLKDSHIEELLNLFKTTTDFIYFDYILVHKLLEIRPDIYRTLLEVIVQRIESGQKTFMIDRELFKRDIHLINDLLLVKKAYFQQDQINQHFDYDFTGFLEIVKLDEAFLLEYIKAITNSRFSAHCSDYLNLTIIWQLQSAEILIGEVLDYLVVLDLYTVGEDFASIFFSNLKEDQKERAHIFLLSYLRQQLNNSRAVDMIMNVARNSFSEREDDFILQFLLENSDLDFFTRVSWQNNFFSGSGNTIWADVRAKRWESILEIFNKITVKPYKYANHKNWIKDRIAMERRSADRERRHIFMYGD